MKKKFLVMLALCMGLMTTSAFAMESADVDLFYYSRNMELRKAIYIENGVYYVPLRECAEKLGATVEYNENKITLRFSPYDYIEYYLKENKVMRNGSISEEGKGEVKNIKGYSYVNVNDFFSLLNKEIVEVDDAGKKVLMAVYPTYGMPVTLTKRTNDFHNSLALLQAIPQKQNGVVSPISMKLSLAMLANGATGQSQQEILNVLGYKSLEELNNFVSKEALQWTVEERRTDENFQKQENQGKLVFCNGLWYNSGDQQTNKNVFSDHFQNTAKNIFSGVANTVTNKTALNIINQWGKQATQGFLPQIIDNANFETALINTAYFKCCWAKEFEPEATKKAVFHNIDGSQSNIYFMNMNSTEVSYCETDSWQMLGIPYNDYSYTMYLFLPEKANYKPLDNDTINKLMTYQHRMEVELSIPKMEIENSFDMTETLKAMGLNAMYQNNNDFSAMYADGVSRFVTKTLQKTKITVNESGTEAAAATQHAMAGAVGDMSKPPVFQADRPFTYMITKYMGDETKNEEVLFIGQFVTGKE